MLKLKKIAAGIAQLFAWAATGRQIAVRIFTAGKICRAPRALIAAVVVAAFGLAGCGTIPTTAGYEQLLNSWVGADADRLVVQWGPPQRSFDLNNGGEVLEYVSVRTYETGGYTTTRPKTTTHSGTVWGDGGLGGYSGTTTTYETVTSPVVTHEMVCKTQFTVNARGVVVNWKWQGNDCRARACHAEPGGC